MLAKSRSFVKAKSMLASLRRFLEYMFKYNHFSWRYFRNRRSRAHWLKNPAELNPAVAPVVEELKRHGICSVHFTKLLPEKTLKEVTGLAETTIDAPSNRALIKEAEENVSTGDSDIRGNYYQVKLWSRLDQSTKKTFVHLAARDEFLAMASSYLGLSCSLSYVDLWYNVPLSGPSIRFQRWHRDGGDRKIVKLYIYLNDVGESQGPLCYVRGSHKFGRPYGRIFPRWGPVREDMVESDVAHDDKIICTGEAGTIVVADTTGIHKGGHVRSGHRLIFYAMYSSEVGRPEKGIIRYDSYLGPTDGVLSPAQTFALTP